MSLIIIRQKETTTSSAQCEFPFKCTKEAYMEIGFGFTLLVLFCVLVYFVERKE